MAMNSDEDSTANGVHMYKVGDLP